MKVLVLYSGGLDSTVALAMALYDQCNDEVEALSFDYGQTNIVELTKARRLSYDWGFDLTVKNIDVGNNDPLKEIPARNTLFLAFALQHSLSHGFDSVVFGAEPDSTYVDSSVEYLESMSEIYRLHGVELTFPIKGFADKTETVVKALDLGVPIDLIHSSLTNSVNGACKTSKRYLDSFKSLFSAASFGLISKIDDYSFHQKKPGNWKCKENINFKYLPALYLLAAKCPKKTITVYSTGNWANALQEASLMLGLDLKFDIQITDDLEFLTGNELNTDAREAQWGYKQALSRLPRPRYCKKPFSMTVVQGHFRMAVESLGYEVGKGEQLITE